MYANLISIQGTEVVTGDVCAPVLWLYLQSRAISPNTLAFVGIYLVIINKWDPFEFFTNYTKMPIVEFLSLLRENKKIQ